MAGISNYEELEIEDAIPVPEAHGRTQGLAQLFKRMKAGQSVFIPYGEKKPQSVSSGCHSSARNAGVSVLIRKGSKEVTVGTGRNKTTETIQGVRVWRVDDKDQHPNGKGPRVK